MRENRGFGDVFPGRNLLKKEQPALNRQLRPLLELLMLGKEINGKMNEELINLCLILVYEAQNRCILF